MKRTLSIFAVSLAFASSAYADFYAGPKIGANFSVGNYTETGQDNSYSIDIKGGAGASFTGGLNMGYDYLMENQLYMAVDSSLMLGSINNNYINYKSANYNMDSILKNNFNYAIALQVGYQLENKIIPYLSLGGYGGEYKLAIKNNTDYAQSGVDGNSTTNIKKTIFAFNPGFGVKKEVHECLVLAIQYDYLNQGKIQKTLTTGDESWTYATKIKQHNVTAALLYKF